MIYGASNPIKHYNATIIGGNNIYYNLMSPNKPSLFINATIEDGDHYQRYLEKFFIFFA